MTDGDVGEKRRRGSSRERRGNVGRHTGGGCLKRAGSSMFVMLIVAGCGPFAAGHGRSGAAEGGVLTLLAAYSAAVEEGRWEDVVDLYSGQPGFEWVEDGRIAYRSRQELRSAFEEVASQFSGAETEFTDVVVDRLAPGTAHVRATVNQRFSGLDGSGFGFTVMFTAVVVETDDGWKFLKGHTSTVRPR